MSGPLDGWRGAIALFVAANLVAVPLIGRLGWRAMAAVTESAGPFAGAMLSVVVAGIVLGLNVLIVRRAIAAGLPRLGQMALFALAGGQFALTIGTGFFSVVNLAAALMA
ncbi:MAG: hypothetical protein ACFBWO_04735 [Paracoccaceae bacterium]